MSPRHLLLALGLAAVWGVNFVVIEVGLAHFPPLLFSALRFLVAAVPAIFFLRSPGVPWRWVALVALTLAVLKFGLLFTGMAAGMPPGLSSLVLQAQAPFTLLFAVLLLKEHLTRRQLLGMAIALGGIALIAVDLGATSPVGAFLLLLGAAALWGLSNVIVRHARPPDMLRFMVWVSALAVLPLFGLSAVFEGDWGALRSVPWPAVGAVLYVGLLATVAGFGAWGFLIRTYSASSTAPFSLLVPVFGMAAAAVFTGETITPVQVVAGVLVIAGVLTGLGYAAARPSPAISPASTSG
ncbi:EamA family transporter [Actinophytocola algeriensis]|uniref:O-acetylserine/cysteine efflux transporter n=1 Tax=Actinophytocola algeriensis TaxID=1768010 RepID=A0A7W7VFB1_9PSEU|nr:EamA family transporter [Actinophytocola algeriensis]MBB4908143.1 O-acetylserine/cysteine efflux transporter [Actinophytocola algeriensis]MBE1480173.1 O-acetylserine/cysteine efflux transporter [Actinophytocola algeriensis]